MLKPYISKLIAGESLKAQEAEAAMKIIMGGHATNAQIGGYLVALRIKGETVEEIIGSARAMRCHAKKVNLCNGKEPLYDTAGTGGDGANTFNISTAVAFIIAGAGHKVAKHGNRAASSKCGSADVLSELGVQIDLTPEQVATCIEQIGIGFLFAPGFHPAMKHAIKARRELGHRTIFNLLGPITNPADATHQLIGVYDQNLTQPIAEVLAALGGKAAFVVHGHGGLDELSTSGPNRVSHLQNDKVRTYDLDPSDLGLRRVKLNDLKGGEPSENAQILHSILSGEDRSSRRDVLLLNAGVALAAETGDLRGGLEEARRSLDSGAAFSKLISLANFSQTLIQTPVGAVV
jgi:anthranilate phosphoribosyltransferase